MAVQCSDAGHAGPDMGFAAIGGPSIHKKGSSLPHRSDILKFVVFSRFDGNCRKLWIFHESVTTAAW